MGCFPSFSLSRVQLTQVCACRVVVYLFRQRACGSALEIDFIVSHFLAFSSWLSEPALVFDSPGRFEWGCVKVHTPHVGQPEVSTNINEALPPTNVVVRAWVGQRHDYV